MVYPKEANPAAPSTLIDGGPLPKLIAFDLDYTLWNFWVDHHLTPPLEVTGNYNSVQDYHKNAWGFYSDVPALLHMLRSKGIRIAAASRTQAPELAREMLSLLHLDPADAGSGPGKRAIDYFDELEIYAGSKTTHFKILRQKTELDYAEMLFFDDEPRNRDVERELGVHMILVPRGVNHRVFDEGVIAWRERRKKGGNGS